MGILRTDKVSGLETPTPVTGSVVFDGTGDYVTSSAFHIADSWTMEFWYNTSVNNASQRPMNFSSDLSGSNYVYIELGSSGNIKARVAGAAAFGSINAPPLNQWHHTALSYDGSTAYFLLNGKLIATQSVSYSNHSIQVRFGADESNTSANLYTGYISNARIVSGKALYTTNYTLPIHAFEVTNGTNLLCFNNTDSAAASEHGLIGISPPTLTVTGDAAASTFSPSLTRDFTGGTEFRGVTTFDTQGYFVPPSGTTEQRGRGRGLWAGGDNPGGGDTKIIDFIQIQSGGMGLDFGDLTVSSNQTRGVSSFTRGVFGGGRRPHPATSNIMDYVTIATTSNAVDFGDLTDDRAGSGEISSSTRGIFAAGYGPANTNTIDFITIASLGNAQDFGDTVNTANGMAGTQSQTRGILAGANGPSSPNASNVIQFLTIATTGNAQDFGDLADSRHSASGTSNGIRAIFMGGDHLSPAADTTIDYITISTTGNAQDFGDLETITIGTGGATSDKIRGVFALGYSGSAHLNVIQQVTIATTGDAVQIGDLTALRHQPGCLSDTHGGLS